MNTVNQKVEAYFDMIEARNDMREHIDSGWRIHSVAMNSCNNPNGFIISRVLVVYERDFEVWD